MATSQNAPEFEDKARRKFNQLQSEKLWDLSPRAEQFCEISETPNGTRQLKVYWTHLGELLRHEDTLLNNRLQAFLVTTAFLLAAFSQFHYGGFAFLIIRIVICGFGLLLAWFTRNILTRPRLQCDGISTIWLR